MGGQSGTMLSVARHSALRTLRAQTCSKSLFAQTQSSSLARLLSTLAILEQEDGKINTGSLGAVTAGQKLGGPIHGFVAGKAGKSLAQAAAKIQGLEKVIAVENEACERITLGVWKESATQSRCAAGCSAIIGCHVYRERRYFRPTHIRGQCDPDRAEQRPC